MIYIWGLPYKRGMWKGKDDTMEGTLYLRKATPADLEILFQWANDGETRKNAFSTNEISYKEHIAWFQALLHDPHQAQYILMEEDMPIGQIRLNIENDVVEIDYSISAQHRHYGYGKEIIRLIRQKVRNEYPGIVKLIARVKPSNIASISCFIANEFEENYRFFEYDMGSHWKYGKDTSFVKDTGGGGKSPLFDEQQECP